MRCFPPPARLIFPSPLRLITDGDLTPSVLFRYLSSSPGLPQVIVCNHRDNIKFVMSSKHNNGRKNLGTTCAQIAPNGSPTSEEEQIRLLRIIKQDRAPKSFNPTNIIYASVNLGTWVCEFEMPLPGSVYTKSQCLHIIKTATRKGSGERRKLIDFMAQYDLVPSKTGVYKLLHRDEMGITIKGCDDDSWGMSETNYEQQYRGDPHILSLPFDLDRHLRGIKHSQPVSKKRKRIGEVIDDKDAILEKHWNKKGWKGRIRFHLDRIRFCGKQTIDQSSYQMNVPLIDICDYIGDCGLQHQTPKWKTDEIHSLYFDPNRFPPPTDIDNGGTNDTFQKLKMYIETVADAEGSPVTCSSGNKKRHNKVFICKKNKSGKRKSCPFSFLVSWDEQGYFINLLSKSRTRLYTSGCPWHCCTH